MKTETARQIPILEVCQVLGLQKEKESGGNVYYKSPRVVDQKTGSLSVSPTKSVWQDYATGDSGDAIGLVEYANAVDFKAAMQWLDDHISSFSTIQTANQPMIANPGCNGDNKQLGLHVLEVKKLYAYPLKQYLEARGIPIHLATLHVQEVRYNNNGREFYAVGFRNDAGGYELRSATFKGSSAPKEVTFIKGKLSNAKCLTVFEGFIDFLSALVWFKTDQPNFDTVILNSAALISHILPLLSKYQAIQCYLDCDTAGQTILQKLQSGHENVIDRSILYRDKKFFDGRPVKDFNDFLLTQNQNSYAS